MEFADAPVPIRARVTARSASSTALLDGLAPPWQRMPEPAVDRPAVRLACAAAERSPGDRSPGDAHPDLHDADPHDPYPRDPYPRDPVARDGAARPVRPVSELAARRAVPPGGPRPPVLSARPRVVEEPSILGLSRRTRSRAGSRLFTLFFVAVFTLIALQMVLEILYG